MIGRSIKIIGITLLSLCTFLPGYGQKFKFKDYHESIHFIERVTLKSGQHTVFHLSQNSISSMGVSRSALSLFDSIPYILSPLEKELLAKSYCNSAPFFPCNQVGYLGQYKKEQFERKKPILGYFYSNKANLFEYTSEYFTLFINPVINLSAGFDLKQEEIIFQNTRGIQISGVLDRRLFFHSALYETQRNFLNSIDRNIQKYKAIPGEAFYKKYQNSIIDGMNGYDYLNAEAYVGAKLTRHFSARFGHGRFFIGNGIRSLLLSDHSHNYFYLNLDTKFRDFHYKNIFAELAGVSAAYVKGDELLPKKYMAAHYLTYRPWSFFEIGLFESVIFTRDNQFELQYLNPVILYRSVEHFIGSPDNVLMGANVKIDLWKSISIYGQLLLDEFRFDKVIKNDGWWANKYGIQAGIKYFDVLNIPHLYAQYEFNRVRPYTYSHRDSLNSYSHFHQALAHPLGANFNEQILKLSYRINKDLSIQLRGIYTIYGADEEDKNWGNNILLSSNSRELEEGNIIGQGIQGRITQLHTQITYEWFTNSYWDFDLIWRKDHLEGNPSINNLYMGTSIRMNIASKFPDY